MSKVNGQSVADREEHVGGTHPYFFFHVEHGPVACGLWCVLVGGTHPFFPFPLEGWGNTPSPLLVFVRIKTINLKFILRV